MSRLVAIGLVLLVGCAKREAPAKQQPAATGSAAAVDPAVAKEEARAQGVLGPSNQGAFDDQGPDFQAKGGGGVGSAPTGKLELGKVWLAGQADGAAVTAALMKRHEELLACYQDVLGATPTLAGTLTLSFTLKPDGSLADVTVSSSTLKDESLATCIVDSAKAARLATPKGKTPVKGSISLAFTP